jgi:O-antigen ligase
VLVAAGFGYFLVRDRSVAEYLSLWRKNWPLAFFILLTFVSISWSMGPIVTLYRALELLFATLIAAYIGMYFQMEDVLEFLFWFGAGLFILSIALVFGAPKTGTMYWAPFYGAWRGVYWHRNHLATITALLSAVYLCRFLPAFQSRNSKSVLDGVFYMVALVILYFARSATGYIVFFVLNVLVLMIWLWLQNAHRLQQRHYVLILGGSAIAVIVILSNLNFVFSLLHRDATLTGRVNLWSHLLDVASQRPWFGHGFGAVWTFESFREQIQQLVGWTSQPLIGDNGFLDILLHLGIVGFVLFVCVLIVTPLWNCEPNAVWLFPIADYGLCVFCKYYVQPLCRDGSIRLVVDCRSAFYGNAFSIEISHLEILGKFPLPLEQFVQRIDRAERINIEVFHLDQ